MGKLFFMLMLPLMFCGSKSTRLKIIFDLPSQLDEVSGLYYDAENRLYWMVNDSGNKSILYAVNRKGKITKKVKINAKNNDWEDLAADKKNLFIGDFGNNNNDRQNLSILVLKKDDILKEGVKEIVPEKIKFSYPSQKKFPPKKSKRHFDCEAFFYFKDSLYLLTKSRSENNSGLTKIYQLPAEKGTYQAKLIDSYNICENKRCRITSADINVDNNRVVLLLENGILLLTNFNQKDFFKGSVKRYFFNRDTQKESVVFKNDSTLYIADEYESGSGGNLYEYTLNN